jgi:CRP-like cAMP-binding protein
MATDGLPFPNLLLRALSTDERNRLVAGATALPIEAGWEYFQPGDEAAPVYFPLTGVVSMTTDTADGRRVETATLGRESFFVAPAALAATRVGEETYVGQIAGSMLAIEGERFRSQYGEGGELHEIANGYLQAFMAQLSSGAACNALHHLEQRCAKWLLECHDRVDGYTFDLRQDFLATMLGCTRPSVSLVAGTLQDQGLITYSRGHMLIVDREGLEQVSCECYEKVRREYARLVLTTSEAS